MTESGDLQPLVTRCTKCHTQFRVNEAQLQVAGGKVRCGACLTVFQGVDNLVWEQDELDEDADVTLDDLLDELTRPEPPRPPMPPANSETAEEPVELELAPLELTPATEVDLEGEAGESAENSASDDDATEQLAAAVAETFTGSNTTDAILEPEPEPEPEIELEAEPAPEPGPEVTPEPEPAPKRAPAATREPERVLQPADAAVAPASETDPAASADPMPESTVPDELEPDPFERLSANKSDELPTPGAQRGWLLYAVSAVGVLLLIVQVLIFRFDAWTQDPGMRSIYTTLCPVFGCDVPPLQALDQMESRNLTVRSHPELEGALMVDTVIVNNAEFSQAFPVIELTFTDIQGKVVAGRRFEPEEYLAGELKGAKSIASRTPVRIKLEIRDPGKSAVSYKMDFR